MTIVNGPFLVEFIIIFTTLSCIQDIHAVWMQLKGCRNFSSDTTSLYNISPNNTIETCLGRCPEKNTIAMQLSLFMSQLGVHQDVTHKHLGHYCLCNESTLQWQPTYNEGCVVCTGAQPNCQVTDNNLWQVYEKVSESQLDFFDISNVEPNNTACLVVNTQPDTTLQFLPVNCSLQKKYLCIKSIPPITKCLVTHTSAIWSYNLPLPCKEIGKYTEPVTTKKQLDACAEKNMIKTAMTIGIQYWLGIIFITPEAETLSSSVAKEQSHSTEIMSSTVASTIAGTRKVTTSLTTNHSIISTIKLSSSDKTTEHPSRIIDITEAQKSTQSQESNLKDILIVTTSVTGGFLLLLVAFVIWWLSRQNRALIKAVCSQQRTSEFVPTYRQRQQGPRSIILTDDGRYIDSDEFAEIDETMFRTPVRLPYSAPSTGLHNGYTTTGGRPTEPNRNTMNTEAYSFSRTADRNIQLGVNNPLNIHTRYPVDTRNSMFADQELNN